MQANSNTYAPLKVLKEKYERLLKIDNVIGLDIATRSDCLNKEILDYLEELNKRCFLMVEIGLQSSKEESLKLIKRGHDLKSFEWAVKELKQRGIMVVVHIINGLPYETHEDMINTVKYLNKLNIDGIKIHMLYIEKGTEIEEMYNQKKFKLLTRSEYIDIVCEQLRYLKKEIVVMRLTGDPEVKYLIEPTWLIKKVSILNDIDKEMKKRDIYQGDLV